MKSVFFLLSVVILACVVQAEEVKGRTWDVLSNAALAKEDSPVAVLTAQRVKDLGGRQIPLCMIGDSSTWAQDGDYWRKWLVKRLPTVAFMGTHTARFGFSHAGEGGHSTHGVLNRVDDPDRIPDCPYYHLLIGINDCSAAKCEADVPRVSASTAIAIWKIVDRLLARSATKKVFLASILPAVVPRNPFRDFAGSAVNTILRGEVAQRYPADRVVWVEYEKPLRAQFDQWKRKECIGDGLHPASGGYRILADMLGDVLEREVKLPAQVGVIAKYGVEVENLWNDLTVLSRPLIPGWYVLSFDPASEKGKLNVRLFTETDKPKSVYDKTVELTVRSGRRCELEFMTGYEGYGYNERPFHLEVTDGVGRLVPVKDVQIEKMRPSCKASRYGKGKFIDNDDPISAGELLVRVE